MRHQLAAVAADLRHLQGFLEATAEGARPSANSEEVRLGKLARQMARWVGKLAEELEAALGAKP